MEHKRKHSFYIEGTLDEVIKEALATIERYTLQSYSFSQSSPTRRDLAEYPMRAVREAIANAVMHRDYELSRTNTTINMFDDRLEILSPGGLYGIVNKANFGTGVNDYRNPEIALNLKFMGLVEKAATGILLIRRQMRENGSLEPIFEIGENHLLVKLPAHPRYVAARLYEKGLVEIERGNLSEAESLFKRAVEAIPQFAEAWAALGKLEGIYGNEEVADNYYRRAIAENPRFEKAYWDWARLAEQNDNMLKSEETLHQGLTLLPDSGLLWLELMRVNIKLDKPESARKCFDAAYRLGSRPPQLFDSFYKYLSQHNKHAEALRVEDLAAQEGIRLHQTMTEK